ncbi:hypothetical protein GWI33_013004 [Rhynchophorus ferrugineus]|uniref:Uncharacterized protein n=1 Tax=Rhynchophorus ferrugineus TaxID=354439 RepID=A0A834I7X3_RHYFE|nr:hypothetical protein GWI33_013004 [Rhynchophorus ferrugineus]
MKRAPTRGSKHPLHRRQLAPPRGLSSKLAGTRCPRKGRKLTEHLDENSVTFVRNKKKNARPIRSTKVICCCIGNGEVIFFVWSSFIDHGVA